METSQEKELRQDAERDYIKARVRGDKVTLVIQPTGNPASEYVKQGTRRVEATVECWSHNKNLVVTYPRGVGQNPYKKERCTITTQNTCPNDEGGRHFFLDCTDAGVVPFDTEWFNGLRDGDTVIVRRKRLSDGLVTKIRGEVGGVKVADSRLLGCVGVLVTVEGMRSTLFFYPDGRVNDYFETYACTVERDVEGEKKRAAAKAEEERLRWVHGLKEGDTVWIERPRQPEGSTYARGKVRGVACGRIIVRHTLSSSLSSWPEDTGNAVGEHMRVSRLVAKPSPLAVPASKADALEKIAERETQVEVPRATGENTLLEVLHSRGFSEKRPSDVGWRIDVKPGDIMVVREVRNGKARTFTAGVTKAGTQELCVTRTFYNEPVQGTETKLNVVFRTCSNWRCDEAEAVVYQLLGPYAMSTDRAPVVEGTVHGDKLSPHDAWLLSVVQDRQKSLGKEVFLLRNGSVALCCIEGWECTVPVSLGAPMPKYSFTLSRVADGVREESNGTDIKDATPQLRAAYFKQVVQNLRAEMQMILEAPGARTAHDLERAKRLRIEINVISAKVSEAAKECK